MNETTPTGNPVFDYKAGWRKRSALIQKWLLVGGLVVFILSWATRSMSASDSRFFGAGNMIGLAAIVAGMGWGFYWRSTLRKDFQRRFGPQADNKLHGSDGANR